MKVLYILKGFVWLVWLALLTTSVLGHIYMHDDPTDDGPLFAFAPLGLLLAPASFSLAIRFFLIPRCHPVIIAILTVVGLALAESLSVYGIFRFSNHHWIFFAVGLGCILAYLPLWLFSSRAAARTQDQTAQPPLLPSGGGRP